MEGIQYVYFEKVMFINISMNWLILWLTGRFGRVATPVWRLLVAALVGALYSFTLLLPELFWVVNFGSKVVFSVLMVAIAFIPLAGSKLWRLMIYFYLNSFALGGAIFGLGFLAVPGTPAGDMLLTVMQAILKIMDDCMWWLFPTVVLGALTYGYWSPVFRQYVLDPLCRVPFKIKVGEQEKELFGLLDTGNQVRDPLSQYPVVIVEIDSIRELLPPSLQTNIQLATNTDVWKLLASLEDEQEWVQRWRVLPFASVGKPKGVMLGFKPDYVEFQRGSSGVKENQVVIGLSQNRLSGDGSYRALLPSEWLGY